MFTPLKTSLGRIVVVKSLESPIPWNDVLSCDTSTQSCIVVILDCIYDLRSVSSKSTSTVSSSNSFFGWGDESKPFRNTIFRNWFLTVLVDCSSSICNLWERKLASHWCMISSIRIDRSTICPISHQQMTIPPPAHPTKLPKFFQESVTFVAHRKQLLPAKEESPSDSHENLVTMPNRASFLKPSIYYQKRDWISGPRTPFLSTRTLNAPLLKSSCTPVNSSSIVYNSSSLKSHAKYSTPVSRLAKAPEMPPVLHLQKDPAIITFPEGISCVISQRPYQSGITKTTEPLSSSSNSARNFPTSVKNTKANSDHAMIKKYHEGTKLEMVDGRILSKVYCEKLGNEHVSGADLKIRSPGSNAKLFEKTKFRKSKALHDVGTRRKRKPKCRDNLGHGSIISDVSNGKGCVVWTDQLKSSRIRGVGFGVQFMHPARKCQFERERKHFNGDIEKTATR